MDTPCQSVRGHLCNTDRVEVIGDCVNYDLHRGVHDLTIIVIYSRFKMVCTYDSCKQVYMI